MCGNWHLFPAAEPCGAKWKVASCKTWHCAILFSGSVTSSRLSGLPRLVRVGRRVYHKAMSRLGVLAALVVVTWPGAPVEAGDAMVAALQQAKARAMRPLSKFSAPERPREVWVSERRVWVPGVGVYAVGSAGSRTRSRRCLRSQFFVKMIARR